MAIMAGQRGLTSCGFLIHAIQPCLVCVCYLDLKLPFFGHWCLTKLQICLFFWFTSCSYKIITWCIMGKVVKMFHNPWGVRVSLVGWCAKMSAGSMAVILFFTFFPRCFRASSDLLNPETNSVWKGTGNKLRLDRLRWTRAVLATRLWRAARK